MQWRRDSLFNKWYWKNWTAARKRMKLEYSLTTCAKINSKQIKNKVLYKILKPQLKSVLFFFYKQCKTNGMQAFSQGLNEQQHHSPVKKGKFLP